MSDALISRIIPSFCRAPVVLTGSIRSCTRLLWVVSVFSCYCRLRLLHCLRLLSALINFDRSAPDYTRLSWLLSSVDRLPRTSMFYQLSGWLSLLRLCLMRDIYYHVFVLICASDECILPRYLPFKPHRQWYGLPFILFTVFIVIASTSRLCSQ